MDCPHCGKAFHDAWNESEILGYGPRHQFRWTSRVTICPACSKVTIDLVQYRLAQSANGGFTPATKLRVYPQSTGRKPIPTEVPAGIAADYEEACRVLPISHKASAALSRRCLQTILREQGYSQHDLSKQIEALQNEADPTKAIPTGLRTTVDAVRNFGNFSAHPITDKTSLQIIDVEPGEAEWCLDILEEMFDHFYVKPALARARKRALDAKLKAAGKPPSK